MRNAASVLCSAMITFGTLNNASYQNLLSRRSRKSKRTSTIQSNPWSASLPACRRHARSSMREPRHLQQHQGVSTPPRSPFISEEEYGSTIFHELMHSTGHSGRLARESIVEAAEFGSAVYSKEELIAKMGGGCLCAEAGISNPVVENQAAGWLKKWRARHFPRNQQEPIM